LVLASAAGGPGGAERFAAGYNHIREDRASRVDRQASQPGDLLQEFVHYRRLMQMELQKVIVGQQDVVEQLFAAIFMRGHCLLEGVPGLAKTLMVSTLVWISTSGSNACSSPPDSMPADITGTNAAGRR
jgi:hypothetical protein